MDSSSVNSELTDLNNPDVPIDQKVNYNLLLKIL